MTEPHLVSHISVLRWNAPNTFLFLLTQVLMHLAARLTVEAAVPAATTGGLKTITCSYVSRNRIHTGGTA